MIDKLRCLRLPTVRYGSGESLIILLWMVASGDARQVSREMGLRRSFVHASLLVALGACASRPDVSELIAEPVVATKFDPRIDFGSFDTFAVNPTVSVVRDVGDGGTLSPNTASGIVERITANMSARGYDLVALSERPSLGLQATVFLQINVTTTSFAGAWWGAPGFASTPAFWGFPSSFYGVPWGYSTTAFRSGTLVIECVDLRDAGVVVAPDASVGPPDAEAGSTGQLEIVWAAYAHGVAQELLTSLEPDALFAIDQAFVQSPYLRRQASSP